MCAPGRLFAYVYSWKRLAGVAAAAAVSDVSNVHHRRDIKVYEMK